MHKKNRIYSAIVVVLLVAASCQKSDVQSPSRTGEFNESDFGLQTASSAPTSYLSRALVEDYTGAWCGYCPRLGYKFDELTANNPRIILQANHNDDVMQTTDEAKLEGYYPIIGFPTAWMMRNKTFNDNGDIIDISDTAQVSAAYLGTNASVGLAIGTRLKGNLLKGIVRVGFGETYTEPLKLVINLVEDNIVASDDPQSNYYNTSPVGNPFFGLGSYIPSYIHHNVYRTAATDALGDLIPADKTVAGKQYDYNFTINLSQYNKSNCKIIAFVVVDEKKLSLTDVYIRNKKYKGIQNVQWVNAGSYINYEAIQ